MKVVATAGHVDHGKSTLIRALTGMEPDRWAEERRRGMTIDLGFAWTAVGDDTVAFVDVPGHERFVSQMLAGVGPVPATMFVVAADSGWMPQSGEHLDALHALGVRHGLLVVTRSDLADPELARDEALEHLAESTLGRLPAVCVSGATGAGLDALRAGLASLVASLPAPDLGADVRLWVDRAFTVRGAGTVVTGTLGAGTVAVGDVLDLHGRPVTVRGVQSLGAPVEAADAVARVALNLRGVDLDQVARGDALTTPGRWLAADVVDVRLHAPRGADLAADLPAEVMLHVGSAAVAARVRPLSRDDAPDAPDAARIPRVPSVPSVPRVPSEGALRSERDGRGFGEGCPSPTKPSEGAVHSKRGGDSGGGATRTLRLTLRVPLTLRPGDRALLRDPGAHRVLGGVDVLDVRPPALRRRGAARVRAEQLAATGAVPDVDAELAQRRIVRRDELTALGLAVPEGTPEAAGWLVAPDVVGELATRLVTAITEHAASQPLDPGLPTKAAARALELPEPRLLDLVVADPAAAAIVRDGGRIRRRDAGGLPTAVLRALDEVDADLARAPFAAPEANRLAELGLGTRELGAAVKAGRLLRVGEGVYLRPDAPDEAVARLAELPSSFTLSEARQALATTRRVAVPLLEYLARQGRTRRDDEDRHALRS